MYISISIYHLSIYIYIERERERERHWVYYMIYAFIIPISKTCVYARVCMHACISPVGSVSLENPE